MKTNRWVQITILVVLIALPAAAGVSNAAPPVSGRSAGPAAAQPADAPQGLRRRISTTLPIQTRGS